MLNRTNILDTLEAELNDYLLGCGEDYMLGAAEVIRGIKLFDEALNKPAVCFNCNGESFRVKTYDGGVKTLEILIYGYVETYNLTDDIHKLLRDVEYFLCNDFSYKNRVYIRDSKIKESNDGANNKALFTLPIDIDYDFKKIEI